MHVLVTGAAGFIGSQLVDALLQREHQVTGVDNFHPFYSPVIKRRHLEAAFQHPRFALHEGDIRDAAAMRALLLATRPQVVVHLAALAGVRPSIVDPAGYFDVNVTGTATLLEACRAANVTQVVFASSSSIYGASHAVPFSETERVDAPISPYAASKRAAELLCRTYAHLHGFTFACLRFFTVYGPRQRPDLAIHKFAQLIDNGQPIPFFGDGSSRRDYTFIEDTLDGILGAIRWVQSRPAGSCEVFNLGESHTVSLKELVSALERALGKEAQLQRLPDQPGDVPITFADISKARQMLGYHPQVDFSTGIDRFIEWYRAQR